MFTRIRNRTEQWLHTFRCSEKYQCTKNLRCRFRHWGRVPFYTIRRLAREEGRPEFFEVEVLSGPSKGHRSVLANVPDEACYYSRPARRR